MASPQMTRTLSGFGEVVLSEGGLLQASDLALMKEKALAKLLIGMGLPARDVNYCMVRDPPDRAVLIFVQRTFH